MSDTQSTEATHSYTKDGADNLRESIHSAVAAHTSSCIELCRLLYLAQYGTITGKNGEETPLVLAWGHDNFDEFAEHELEMHMTTARVYVGVYDELLIRRGLAIGAASGTLPNSITKLKKLARLSRRSDTDARKLNQWIGKAREMSCCEFDNAIDGEIEGKPKQKNIGFAMKWSHAKTLYRALGHAKERFGVKTNGEALSRMAEAWEASDGWNAQRAAAAGRKAKAS